MHIRTNGIKPNCHSEYLGLFVPETELCLATTHSGEMNYSMKSFVLFFFLPCYEMLLRKILRTPLPQYCYNLHAHTVIKSGRAGYVTTIVHSQNICAHIYQIILRMGEITCKQMRVW